MKNENPTPPGAPADLSEVLRRQAEELARLSRQLSGTVPGPGLTPSVEREVGAEKPPVQTWMPPVKAGPVAGESALPVLASDPALSADSLPVLDAFRQFLDEERRRTRRRMVRLMLAGGGLVVAAVAVLAWVFTRSLDETRRNLQVTQMKASQMAADQAKRVGQVSLTTSNLERRLTVERQKVQSVVVAATNLQKTLEAESARHEQTRAVLESTIREQQEEIQRLHDMLTTLEIDNALLMGSVRELQGEGDARIEEEPELLPVMAQPSWMPEGAWVAPVAPPPPASTDTPAGARVPIRLPNP